MPIDAPYSLVHEPPAPVLEIGIAAYGEAAPKRTVHALMDSGADVTLVPEHTLLDIGARYVERRSMKGVTGEVVAVNLYLIAVCIGAHNIQGIRAVAGTPDEEVILGRDVLNQLVVTFNGPDLMAKID